MGKGIQDLVLGALNVELDGPYAFISWDAFAQLNCLTYYFSASTAEEIDFYSTILDPKTKGTVPCSEIDNVLNIFFGGHFTSNYKDSDAEDN